MAALTRTERLNVLQVFDNELVRPDAYGRAAGEIWGSETVAVHIDGVVRRLVRRLSWRDRRRRTPRR